MEEILDSGIRVKIQRETACGHCNAQGLCNMSDGSERIFEINENTRDLRVGDHVGIKITKSLGNRAVVLGYLIPFLLLLSVLIILTELGIKDWLSGLISVATLGPYYSIMYLFRNRLSRTFAFTIRKTAL